MLKPIALAKKALLVSLALVMVNIPTAAVFADDPPVCTAPSQDGQIGVHWPTGSDAGTFTYQCDGTYAGQWTNAYYVYDPATNSESALYDRNYTYDCTAQQWYMTDWHYSPAQGIYIQSTVSTSAPSGLATGCPPVVPAAPVVVDPATIDPNKTVDTNGDGILDSPTTPQTLALAQANGGIAVNLDGTLNTTVNNSTTASMNNRIISLAGTGNANIIGNTTGGSANSGDAATIANIINMLQSSSNVLGGPNMVTFTANINGDVNGDLLLNPAQLGAVQPANTSDTLDNKVTVNNSTGAAINNTVNLDANSGNATVANNTTGGDATTGNAKALANIVNVLNSAVTAGQSFIGVININGDLNGDILLPPNFVDTLLANNVPHSTINTASITGNYNLNNTNTVGINNNVNAGAATGDASVAHNTTGGSATSGMANTNVTVFNLTGSDVVASNDLLVFVNVLGKWVGLIMNAPAGSTAAELGGGVSSNTSITNDATLNNSNTDLINNNVNVKAKTGDASVTGNTSGGNATSGNADASVNILNMINNKLSLNGWFGLLFINVYGTWNGSFGVNTSAGDPITTPTANVGDSIVPVQTFRFVPSTSGGSGSGNSGGSQGDVDASTTGAVLAAHTDKVGDSTVPQLAGNAQTDYALPIAGVILALLILGFSERKRFFHHNQA